MHAVMDLLLCFYIYMYSGVNPFLYLLNAPLWTWFVLMDFVLFFVLTASRHQSWIHCSICFCIYSGLNLALYFCPHYFFMDLVCISSLNFPFNSVIFYLSSKKLLKLISTLATVSSGRGVLYTWSLWCCGSIFQWCQEVDTPEEGCPTRTANIHP